MADERKIYIKSGGYKEIHNTGLYVEGNYYKGTLNPQVIDSVTTEIENLLVYFQENEDPSMREAIAVVEESKSKQPELNNSDTIRAVIDNSPTLKRRLLSITLFDGASVMASNLLNPLSKMFFFSKGDYLPLH